MLEEVGSPYEAHRVDIREAGRPVHARSGTQPQQQDPRHLGTERPGGQPLGLFDPVPSWAHLAEKPASSCPRTLRGADQACSG